MTGNLPNWSSAAHVYTQSYAMLQNMARQGHVEIVRKGGKAIGSIASQDMKDVIEALNKGDEETIKGYLALGREYGWI